MCLSTIDYIFCTVYADHDDSVLVGMLVPLFQKYKVTAYMNGHRHLMMVRGSARVSDVYHVCTLNFKYITSFYYLCVFV